MACPGQVLGTCGDENTSAARHSSTTSSSILKHLRQTTTTTTTTTTQETPQKHPTLASRCPRVLAPSPKNNKTAQSGCLQRGPLIPNTAALVRYILNAGNVLALALRNRK
ncbi:hypothetical protein E2C01_091108 [Portunus trituberculatus]|uniref:Uncharacterized protein n=1 Tax=Portunus trituberculatus TaxID=210409 RepID=A0A5B7JM43_PORTR|nr:hypothetical protein [Portunus trituberculatus]